MSDLPRPVAMTVRQLSPAARCASASACAACSARSPMKCRTSAASSASGGERGQLARGARRAASRASASSAVRAAPRHQHVDAEAAPVLAAGHLGHLDVVARLRRRSTGASTAASRRLKKPTWSPRGSNSAHAFGVVRVLGLALEPQRRRPAPDAARTSCRPSNVTPASLVWNASASPMPAYSPRARISSASREQVLDELGGGRVRRRGRARARRARAAGARRRPCHSSSSSSYARSTAASWLGERSMSGQRNAMAGTGRDAVERGEPQVVAVCPDALAAVHEHAARREHRPRVRRGRTARAARARPRARAERARAGPRRRCDARARTPRPAAPPSLGERAPRSAADRAAGSVHADRRRVSAEARRADRRSARDRGVQVDAARRCVPSPCAIAVLDGEQQRGHAVRLRRRATRRCPSRRRASPRPPARAPGRPAAYVALRQRERLVQQVALGRLAHAVVLVERRARAPRRASASSVEQQLEGERRVGHAPRGVEPRRERERDLLGRRCGRRSTPATSAQRGDARRAARVRDAREPVGHERAVLVEQRHDVGDRAERREVGELAPDVRCAEARARPPARA